MTTLSYITKGVLVTDLPYEISQSNIYDHFIQYGHINECHIIPPQTSESTPSALVIYSDACFMEALLLQKHFINRHQITCKPYYKRRDDFSHTTAPKRNISNSLLNSDSLDDVSTRKLFIGGLHRMVVEEEMKLYFSQFGEVKECLIMKDKSTGKSRGFGFVIFANHNSVRNVLTYPYIHSMRNKQMECKLATPRETISRLSTLYNQSSSSLGELTSSSSELVNKKSVSHGYHSPFSLNTDLFSPFIRNDNEERYSLTHADMRFEHCDMSSYLQFKLFDPKGERISNILMKGNVIDTSQAINFAGNQKKMLPFDCDLSTSSDYNEVEESNSL